MPQEFEDPGALEGAHGAGEYRNPNDVDFPSKGLEPQGLPTGRALRPEPRPYQRDVIARFDAEVAAGRRRVLLVSPTGSGKTIISAAIIEAAVARGERVLFLAHRRELIQQASSKLYGVGVDHGIIQAGFPTRPGARVQVASVWTLHARAVRKMAMEIPPADLVVVDEAHHSIARTYRRLIAAYPGAAILGLTATPCRGDGRGLGGVFETLIECPSVAELTKLGHLIRAKVYAPSRPDLKGVKVRAGDYAEGELAQKMDVPKLTGDIVSHWLRLAERRPTIVFATSVAHSVHLRDEFRAANVMAEHVDGETPAEERDAIFRQLANGLVEVVTNVGVATEGFDLPDIGCIVLARPTKSLGLYRQMIGRGLRPAPGKTDVLVLDHSGAVFEHGLPDEPVEWTLRDDRRAVNPVQAARKKGQKPRLADCPECHAVRFEGQPCPVCGWRPRPKPEAFAVAMGELGEVDRHGGVVKETYSRAYLQNYCRMLLAYAQETGRKPGWAFYTYRDIFGAKPKWGPWSVTPLPPNDEVRARMRSRDIAYRKSQEKRGAA
jgi:superfamily II DNA or RNA helicase